MLTLVINLSSSSKKSYSVYSVLDALESCQNLGFPTDWWLSKANRIQIQAGYEPSVAYLLVLKSALDDLQAAAYLNNTIELAINNRIGDKIVRDKVKLSGWTFHSAQAVIPAITHTSSGDATGKSDTLYLAKFVDFRYIFQKTAINRVYNILKQDKPFIDPDQPLMDQVVERTFEYFESSLDPDGGDPSGPGPWKWKTMLPDIWKLLPSNLWGKVPDDLTRIDEGGTLPGVSSDSEPLPENYRFYGMSVWDAYYKAIRDIEHEVYPVYLADGTLEFKTDKTGPDSTTSLSSYVNRLIDSNLIVDNLEGQLLPAQWEVHFPKRDYDYEASSETDEVDPATLYESQEQKTHTISTVTLAPAATTIPGTKQVLYAPKVDLKDQAQIDFFANSLVKNAIGKRFAVDSVDNVYYGYLPAVVDSNTPVIQYSCSSDGAKTRILGHFPGKEDNLTSPSPGERRNEDRDQLEPRHKQVYVEVLSPIESGHSGTVTVQAVDLSAVINPAVPLGPKEIRAAYGSSGKALEVYNLTSETLEPGKFWARYHYQADIWGISSAVVGTPENLRFRLRFDMLRATSGAPNADRTISVHVLDATGNIKKDEEGNEIIEDVKNPSHYYEGRAGDDGVAVITENGTIIVHMEDQAMFMESTMGGTVNYLGSPSVPPISNTQGGDPITTWGPPDQRQVLSTSTRNIYDPMKIGRHLAAGDKAHALRKPIISGQADEYMIFGPPRQIEFIQIKGTGGLSKGDDVFPIDGTTGCWYPCDLIHFAPQPNSSTPTCAGVTILKADVKVREVEIRDGGPGGATEALPHLAIFSAVRTGGDNYIITGGGAPPTVESLYMSPGITNSVLTPGCSSDPGTVTLKITGWQGTLACGASGSIVNGITIKAVSGHPNHNVEVNRSVIVFSTEPFNSNVEPGDPLPIAFYTDADQFLIDHVPNYSANNRVLTSQSTDELNWRQYACQNIQYVTGGTCSGGTILLDQSDPVNVCRILP